MGEGLNREGGALINFPSLKRGGLLERGGLINFPPLKRGGLIERGGGLLTFLL